jgi:hypothetical protein
MATSKATLKKVMARKDKLKRAHPGWGPSTLLKEAWKPFKSKGKKSVSGTKRKKKSVSGTRKAPRKRAAPRRVAGKLSGRKVSGTRSRKVSGTSRRKVMGIGDVRLSAREQKQVLLTELGETLARQHDAKTKTDKRRYGKKAAELKKKLAVVGKLL